MDWRFDPMITWPHSVPVTNQSVRVPPGEIQVYLVSKRLNDEAQLLSELPPRFCAATLIQNWLRSTKDPSDQTELRKLLQHHLQDHLQMEFEATQSSRKAEVERLQKLLQKSVEWLDDRAKNRDEIIPKRIDELMQNAVPATPIGR